MSHFDDIPYEMHPIAQEFMDMRPAGGFRVILADPPWAWEAHSEKGYEKSPEAHYGTMSLDWIKALPVQHLAAKDCALFLWVTWPMMSIWNEVIQAWGFEFSGLAYEWIKYNPETGKYAFGPGYGTRKNLEPCLLATKGNPSLRKGWEDDLFAGFEPKGVRSVRDFIEVTPLDCVRAPRRDHSEKPDEQYERIETLFEGPRIELFGRKELARPGWSVWGNQVGKLGQVA